jgi:hypothetical protein
MAAEAAAPAMADLGRVRAQEPAEVAAQGDRVLREHQVQAAAALVGAVAPEGAARAPPAAVQGTEGRAPEPEAAPAVEAAAAVVAVAAPAQGLAPGPAWELAAQALALVPELPAQPQAWVQGRQGPGLGLAPGQGRERQAPVSARGWACAKAGYSASAKGPYSEGEALAVPLRPAPPGAFYQ